MPLTLEELQEIQSDAMADDVSIDFDKMSLWTHDQAVAYFESGGEDIPDISDAAPKKQFPPVAPNKPRPPPRDYAAFEKFQNTVMPGDTYKIVFPYSAVDLTDEKKFGSSWLTEAFQAFGSISKTNSVSIVSSKTFVGGGAGAKCLLTVKYAEEEEGHLHTELFVKMPHLQVYAAPAPRVCSTWAQTTLSHALFPRRTPSATST